MTPVQLEARIAALRSSVRRLLALHGLSWVLGLIVPLIILAGLADWLFHLDGMIRAALLLSLIGGVLWLCYRYVLRPLFVRFADLDIAMRIEERWPGLNDRLASTIQFFHVAADDDRYGSLALREATVRQAVEEASAIDFREVIEPKPVLQALGLASGSLLLAALLVLVAPMSSRIAMRRLVLPFGAQAWPQRTHLVLDERETMLKVALAIPLHWVSRVRPGDRIPESARATYHFADGEEASEPLRSMEGGEFRGRIESVNQPFRFSVTAGDDLNSIRDVDVKVVPPPTLKSLVIRVVSPPYTGLASQVLAPGLTQLRALEGTQLELDALANKPLADAELRLGDKPAGAALVFDQARTRFKTALTVKESFTFWFDLKDTEGFRSREAVRYDVRQFRDEAPRVVIEEPKTDRDVPSAATVPVRVTLDDDFGLHSARLIYRLATGDSEPHNEVAIPLLPVQQQGPEEATPIFVKHQEIGYRWDLAPLKLPVGTVITFHADARDFDTIKGPNVGKSREIRLRIVSKDDASRQVDEARRELREEIARVLTMQKQAITPVDDAIRTLTQTNRLQQKQRDDLNNAGMIQRQVTSRINNRDEGLSAKIRNRLDDFQNFKIANPEAQKQMEEMLARLGVIRDQHLGPAEQGLTRASKNLEQDAANQKPAQPPSGSNDQATKPTPSDPSGAKPSDTSRTNPSPSAKATKGGNQQGESTKGGNQQGESTKGGNQQGGQSRENAKPATPGNETQKPDSDLSRSALAEAKTNQKAIADELQKMLDSLSEFETYRGVVKDAKELVKQQEQAMKQAAESANKPDLMGKTPGELTPEQKADLSSLASRQSEIGKGLQNLLERMGEMAGRLNESDPLASSAMREAAEKNQKRGTVGKLGEAADQLEKNQMGQARSRQEQARNELRDLVDAIQNRRERELARLVKELKNAEAELAQTRARQAQNLKKTREAQQNQNANERREQLKRLAKEQAEIQKDLKRQLQKLAKLSADRAARAGQSASGKMSRAQANLDDDQGEDAGKEQEEALANLEDAQEELEETRRDAEEQLAVEQLARMGDQLKSLAERQEKIVSETASYEAQRRKNDDKLTMAQRAGVKGLGQVQTGLKEETAELIEKLDGAPVFALTLRRASQNMETVAKRLQETKTDKSTEEAARAASDRFKQLLESLKADAAANGAQGGGGGGGGAGGGGGGNGDGIPATAQLKLLKTLQQEINERTDSFDEKKRRNQKLNPEQTADLQRLGEEQGVLADLVRDLTRPKRDDGEE